jgi:uncharacterized RDD family membrane protein YckC
MLPENPTFLVRGDDGVEYGPVDLTELREWVAENRAGIGTEVKRFEPGAAWHPWQDFPELVALLAEVHATGDGSAVVGLIIAPAWRRVLAFMLDLFLASLLSTPLVYLVEAYSGISNIELHYLLAIMQPDAPAPPDIFFYGNLCNIISLLTLVLYYAGFIAAHGRTPAKSIFRLRVVTLDGEKPYFVKSLVRAIVLALSANMLFLPMIPALFNPQRRTLHDLIAGTYVVEA